MPENENRRCGCGHLEAEHNVVYDWSPGLKRCGGALLVVDQFDPDSRRVREVSCLCNGFHEADSYKLAQWDEEAVTF